MLPWLKQSTPQLPDQTISPWLTTHIFLRPQHLFVCPCSQLPHGPVRLKCNLRWVSKTCQLLISGASRIWRFLHVCAKHVLVDGRARLRVSWLRMQYYTLYVSLSRAAHMAFRAQHECHPAALATLGFLGH